MRIGVAQLMHTMTKKYNGKKYRIKVSSINNNTITEKNIKNYKVAFYALSIR